MAWSNGSGIVSYGNSTTRQESVPRQLTELSEEELTFDFKTFFSRCSVPLPQAWLLSGSLSYKYLAHIYSLVQWPKYISLFIFR